MTEPLRRLVHWKVEDTGLVILAQSCPEEHNLDGVDSLAKFPSSGGVCHPSTSSPHKS